MNYLQYCDPYNGVCYPLPTVTPKSLLTITNVVFFVVIVIVCVITKILLRKKR